MASVVSVNISEAKGVRKRPAGSAELLAGHGIAADGHAGDWHRQLSLLAIESIDAMRAKGLDVGPGDFAENITTRGIDLPAVPIGTQLHLGPALIEVTQIGKECHSPCDIFHQAGDCVMPREGIFARVLTGGTIRAGDPIIRGHNTLLSSQSHADAEEATAAVQILEGAAVAVVTVSDSCYRGEREDGSGDLLQRLLAGEGAAAVTRVLVPDERHLIAAALSDLCDTQSVRLVITTGGTGLQERDVTPEASRDVFEREAPGFSEALRAGALALTPRAMLSRGAGGIRGDTLIINFPGSPTACEESFAIIRPVLAHALELLAGHAGQCARKPRDEAEHGYTGKT